MLRAEDDALDGAVRTLGSGRLIPSAITTITLAFRVMDTEKIAPVIVIEK